MTAFRFPIRHIFFYLGMSTLVLLSATSVASELDPAVPESDPGEEEPVKIDAGLDANSFRLVTTNDESGSALVSSDVFAAAKGKCIFPKFTYYPGLTTTGRLRYGQADIRFEICPGKDPTDWKSSISVSPNTTASLQGYNFIKEEIHPTSDGDYYRFYEATFKWQDCLPYFVWPCTEKGTFKIRFYAWVVEGKPGVIYKSASAPPYWTLYNTP